MLTIFFSGSLKGKDHLEDLSVDEKVNIILSLKRRKEVTGFTWLRIGTSCGLVCTSGCLQRGDSFDQLSNFTFSRNSLVISGL
jgi:hypothetical protein